LARRGATARVASGQKALQDGPHGPVSDHRPCARWERPGLKLHRCGDDL